MTAMLTSLCKYIYNSVELASDQPWERKSMYIFYLELFMGMYIAEIHLFSPPSPKHLAIGLPFLFFWKIIPDFTRLVAYMIYFCILMKYYSVPLYILRDVYMTFRSFAKRVQDMMQYYRATANMNERYVYY